jgi:AraC family transcriptional regulator of adaptative response/methylated-DNA-[protein]-cysteine methyltransferase
MLRCGTGTFRAEWTDRGLRRLDFLDENEAGPDGAADPLLRRVTAALEALGAGEEVPLDLRGTPFQLAVWRALRAIPAGRTTTYSALARSLGLGPGAARAVGAACAANPIAVLVPCHRVVPARGGLGGYRWGLDRKRRLLAREARFT